MAPAAHARDCTSNDPGATFGVKVLGSKKGSLRTVQLYPHESGNAASDFRVTVARTRHSTFTRSYSYLRSKRQIRFRLRKGERVNVVATYTEDRSRDVTVNDGERLISQTVLTPQLIAALATVGIDVSGLVPGQVIRETVPVTHQERVTDSCQRTISTSARRR